MTVDHTKSRRRDIGIMMTAVVVLFSTPALAARPALQECKKLDQELAELKSKGVAEGLEKGPDWAKSNLPANRVNIILRYLSVFEKIQFQCEDVFAEAEAIEIQRKAREEARLLALENIPPLPHKRPKIVPKSSASRINNANLRTPPIPAKKR